jgi:hypothetical protein
MGFPAQGWQAVLIISSTLNLLRDVVEVAAHTGVATSRFFIHSVKNKKEFNKHPFYSNKDYIADAKPLEPMIKQAGGMQARRNTFFEKKP